MKTSGSRSLLAGFALAAAVAGYAVAQEVTALTPLSYTPAQVAGGRANFAAKCAKCHGSELEGAAGPALTNGALDVYLSGSVGDLFNYLQASMPQDAPGSLSPAETATLVAYLASMNGRSPGAVPLPSDPSALAKMGFGS